MADIIRREPRLWDRNGAVIATYPVVRCHCGRAVDCDSGWSNACDCGTEYNGSGQQLAPRSQWGEETGESFCDGEPAPGPDVLDSLDH